MASKSAIIERQNAVRGRLQTAMQRLSERRGVPLPPPAAGGLRQPELRAAVEQERLATFLEALVGAIPAKRR